MNPRYRNHILASLPRSELRKIEPHLVPLTLPRGYMLHDTGEVISYAYFLEEGLASIVVRLENGNTVEVGVMGREGVAGLPLLMGTDQMPHQTFMQIAGAGYRVKASALRAIFTQPSQLRTLLLRYLQLHLVQASQTAACNRLHEVEERLARWLLICQDRLNATDIPLTHEFLAQMLGTRRSSVTLAAGNLHKNGLIDYARGHMTIIDQAGLEQASCECYRAIHDEQVRLGLF